MGRRSGFWILPLIFILILSSCGKQQAERIEEDSDASIALEESAVSNESENATNSMTAAESSEESEASEINQNSEELVTFIVKPGSYVTEIASDLAAMGLAEDAATVLQAMETMDRSVFTYWNKAPRDAKRCFFTEGYILPGVYNWAATADLKQVLKILLGRLDETLPPDIEEKAMQQGYSLDEVLIMASIVEYESSFALEGDTTVKPAVAAVVRNRVESGMALQMDVTIFYLQEALSEEEKVAYEAAYDTYLFEGLPAGPIGSPSLDSIQAVLSPADTEDLFFVYDNNGKYYFAKTYEEHLINCELAGLW